MRIALAVEYNGALFCGWQSQPSLCGVQDHLQRALSLMACHEVKVVAAGRTDTGVHALSQIVHFDTETERPDSAWVRGVNARLPPAVRVIWAQRVSEEFHARFSAFARRYQYLLYNHAVAPAVMAQQSGWFHLPLDANTMALAASYLLGEHDFSAFRAAECQAKSPVRTMHAASVKQMGAYIVFEFYANAFLHHQVRNMVGALVYIGKGAHPAEYMQTLLLSKDRTQSPPTFSAHGLYLVGVDYAEKWQLPATQRQLSLLT